MAALIRLNQEHLAEMRREVAEKAPEEACGLVAGKEGSSVKVYPVENTLHSRVRFKMEPRAQVQAMLEIERLGLEILAIFHSHPAGPPIVSPTDIAEAAYPEVPYLIWFPEEGSWQCRAYLIDADQVLPIEIKVERS